MVLNFLRKPNVELQYKPAIPLPETQQTILMSFNFVLSLPEEWWPRAKLTNPTIQLYSLSAVTTLSDKVQENQQNSQGAKFQ